VVSKSESSVRAYDENGKLLAFYSATIGSEHDPLPLGEWKINGIARNPQFHYNAELFWDAKDRNDRQTLPPGPNNPVGPVWIDLSKEHYGIHGTPEPGKIGHTESHGCIRLTNWDALELAAIVRPGTPATLKE
jgi:lipoprotein-anchoring transpeptidase ErfK/SrfK